MINIGFGPNILLGLILGFGVILIYFLRIVKPEIARDEDIFFQLLVYFIAVFNSSCMAVRSDFII